MKKLSLIIMLLFSTILFAQTPEKMSYQAVIRDASGTLITNQTIGMQISILQGSATGTAVYQETQAPISNTNGLVSLEIGTGTVISGDFTNIDWSNGSYFIKTETDPAGGTNYAITGTNQLLSVPYALYAKKSGDTVFTTTNGITSNANGDIDNDDFIFGKTQNTFGKRMLFIKNKGAFRAGSSSGSAWNTSFIGNNSFATGFNTMARGSYSVAMGINTYAKAYAQTTLGTYNTDVSGSSNSFTPTDQLFVIGNGTDTNNKSDAMVVLKNGTITAPSLDIAEITDNKALITKEYLDANTTLATGLEQTTENGNTGWRLTGRNPNYYGDIGGEAVDLSRSTAISTTKGATGNISTAMGRNTTASGLVSTAMGNGTTASGYNSTAMGYNTTASGNNSTAMGYNTTASGNNSTAMGESTTASGYKSTAIGVGLTTESLYQITMGTYNTIGTGSPNSTGPTSRFFVIGNGTNTNNKKDALVMLRNGNTTLNGDLNVNGNIEKVKAADSGDADMKAYVYGLAAADGTSSTVNTDGFVLSKTGTGIYRVTFDVYMGRTSYVAIATLHNTIGFINAIRHHGYVEIRTYNTSGNLSDKGFYFVVYKK